MRYLAIDLGDARTGLAVGDSIIRLASPVGVVECPIDREGGAALLRAVVAAAEAHLGPLGTDTASAASGGIVLGLPLNMDGSEGPRARLVRAWADRLQAALRRPVTLWDERLSSAAADDRLARTGLTRGQKKARRDAIAAAAILDSFLASLPTGPGLPANDHDGFDDWPDHAGNA
jgi:putative Holliday junction resolvase